MTAAPAARHAVAPSGGRRSPDASPIDRLLASPQAFEFHQSVRILDALQRRLPASERPAIRYRNSLSLCFPASEIATIEVERRSDGQPGDDGDAASDTPRASATGASAGDGTGASASADVRTPRPAAPATADEAARLQRIEVTPAFIGLLGVNGALPLAYSEQFALREGVGRDGAARAFLDIFQHRAVSLFHEAWRKHRLPLQFEVDRQERYLPLVLSLIGLGEPALRRRLRGAQGGVADDALAFYAGLLQRRVVSARHLQQVLADYFQVPVEITSWVGRWFALDAGCQTLLGAGSAKRLGLDTVLGERVWQRDLRARVDIGPMSRAQHRRFLPGGPAALALRELLTLVSGVRLEYEVRLTLHADEVTPSVLPSGRLPEVPGPRLGWDSFLISEPPTKDRAEAVYDIHALSA